MKTFAVIALSVVAATMLFPRSTGHAAPYSPPAGRYAIVHTAGENALLLDTATGAVWALTSTDYCQSSEPPYDFRIAAGPMAECKGNESRVVNEREFERLSVQGLYETPIQREIDASFQAQAKRGYYVPKPETKPK
jgi:hypothetical protein